MRDDQKTKAQLIKELREARRRLGNGEQAVASVGESEAKFRAVFEHSSIGKSLTSPDGRPIEVNPAFAAMLGYTVEEMSTLNFATVTHPDDVPESHECIRCLLAGERSTYRMEKRYIHRNGSIVWTLVNTSLLRDEAGAPRFFVTSIQDNTDRKRAEEAFRDANERLESRVLERTAELARSKELLDESGRLARVGGWEIDLTKNELSWTDVVYQIHEVGPEFRPTVETAIQFYAPEAVPVISEAVRRGIEDGEPWDLELPLITAKGNRLWVRAIGQAYRQNGEIVRVGGVFQDITERKRAEEALRESERAFRETLRHLDEAYYSVTPDGLILDHNLAFNRILGIDAGQDMRGRHTPDFWLNPDDRQAYLNELMAKGFIRNYLVDIRTARGEKVVGLFNSHLEKDEQGRLVRIVGTFADFTERKQAEEKIVHLNRILRAVRDINQLIVRERDADRLIEDVCRLVVEGQGYGSAIVVLTDAAGLPRAWAEAGMGDAFLPLAESLRRGVMPPCCLLAQQHEGIYHVTDRAAVCSPCPIWVKSASTDSSCIQLRHGETMYGYLSVSVDRMLGVVAEQESLLAELAGDVAYALRGIEQDAAMTQAEEDRDRAEREMRQSQKMEAVGALAGGVAHDFNNILTVINTSCSFLEEGLQKSEPLFEDVRTIREAAQSAARLNKQLLAFSRRQVLEPRPLDLNTLVGESQKMLGRLIGEDITIRVEPAPALGLVLADPGQLEQVIVNLAVNARDAMPNGGTLTIATANVELDEVFVSLHAGSRAGPVVRLAVTDTGVGMDAETLARVFEPFFTTKEVGRGTGLGLSTVYGIVKQSGGFISVNSEPGRGATFEIYLPRVESADQPWQPSSEAGSARARGEAVLLVEDNDQVRAVATRTLRELGYRVFGAAGLDEARRIAATEGPIHLLLTDVVMPGGSGRDVSIAVTAAHPAVKVLYMSGFTDDAIVHRGVLEPGTAFLHKPFTPNSLGRKVREVLDG